MVKIRLMRVGSKKNPHYRLIAIPARTKRETKALEILGSYDPKAKKVNFKKDRIKYWRDQGAQPTEIVLSLLGEKKERDYSKFKRVIAKKKEKETEKETTTPKAKEPETTKEEKVESKPETVEKSEEKEDKKEAK